jgi:predicted nuclease with RNAse H fold
LRKESKYDLLSVDLGWSRKKRDLRRVALAFLDFKNHEIYSTYKHQISIKDFLLLLQNLKPNGAVLLDMPLKGEPEGSFRPVERVMQRLGLPCRPSREALSIGKELLLKIESLGFKAIEIYPYAFYKFYCFLPARILRPSRRHTLTENTLRIDPRVFRRFFPPYKRAKKKGVRNAKAIIMRLLDYLGLKLVMDRESGLNSDLVKWDIYDSLFGVIAGFLLLENSSWVRFIKDETGSEILILSDKNLGHFIDIHTQKSKNLKKGV